MKHHALIITLLLAALCALAATAQTPDSTARATRSFITPVKPATNKTLTPPRGTKEEVIERYLTGDTAAAHAQERKDSLKRVYARYPRLTDLTLGLNFADAIFAAFGQKHGGIDVSATLNMWNRLQPTVELGLGLAKDTPDDLNYTYRGKLAPYFKVGANYNFLFKSHPRYQVMAGVRLGFSPFTFDITRATVASGYWGTTQDVSLTGQQANALWGEVVAGIKVLLGGRLSMGWTVRYHGLFTEKKPAHSTPWHIPGYGARDRHWGFTMSLYYTLPLSRDKWPAEAPKK